ncbi:MAG: cation diffusion facilitator family transporter [Thermodesulfobacteriota bacterium]
MTLTSPEQIKNKKLRTALLSITVAIALIIIKLVFGFITNSVSILASAVDSFLDLSASSVNYFSIRKSEKPADHDHRFGHGKAEGLAGLFQCFVIGVSSIYLIYLSVWRLLNGGNLQALDLGIIVIVFSIIVSLLLARYIRRVAKETESIALKADSLHYQFDVYTNIGIVIALTIIKFTDLNLIDPIISIVIAVLIIWSAKDIVMQSLNILMDKELPEEVVTQIEETIMNHSLDVRSFHKLRTRNAGSVKFIEFHVVLNHELTFVKSHELAEDIIKEIEAVIPNSEVTVHVDPDKHPDYS